MLDVQRSRLLTAAVSAVEEFGYTDTTVGRITERARVSRRTFYELFDNREQCLVTVLEAAVAQISGEIAAAKLEGLPWRERVRGGLWVMLSLFDREPALARLCVVQSQRAGQAVLERRQAILDRLGVIVEEGRAGSDSSGVSPLVSLTAQGVVGGVMTVLYARLLKPEQGSLRGLLGDLMAMIVLPYLGPAVARREQARPAPRPVTQPSGSEEHLALTPGIAESLATSGVRLTHRTLRVLQTLAEHPGSSNRQVAEWSGIHDQGQVSKLLARLQRLGLLVNNPSGESTKGLPNEWALTATGEQIVGSITAHAGNSDHKRVA